MTVEIKLSLAPLRTPTPQKKGPREAGLELGDPSNPDQAVLL